MPGRVARLALHIGSDGIGLALSRNDAHGGRTLSDRLMVLGSGRDGQRLLAAVDQLLTSTQTPLKAIEVIAFTAGPGGFSSVRVACSVAQGLALAAGCLVAPVSSLLALALATTKAAADRAQGTTRVIALVDARMQEVYAAVYQFHRTSTGTPTIRVELEPFLARASEIPTRLASLDPIQATTVICGDAWQRYKLTAPTGNVAALAIEGEPPADEIAVACIELSADEQWHSPADAGPIYLREKVALNTAEQAELRARNARAARQP